MAWRSEVWVGLAGVAVLAVACRAPTEVKLEISTDADCGDVTGTTITSGLLVQIEDLPTRRCTGRL